MKVLLLEDDTSQAVTLQRAFAKRSWEVTVATDADDGLWVAGSDRFDVIRKVYLEVTKESKNQIAAMLSFAKKTSLTDELGNADKMYDSLRKKAQPSNMSSMSLGSPNELGTITGASNGSADRMCRWPRLAGRHGWTLNEKPGSRSVLSKARLPGVGLV